MVSVTAPKVFSSGTEWGHAPTDVFPAFHDLFATQDVFFASKHHEKMVLNTQFEHKC